MDFYELEAFTVLARTLHFARAAAAVNTSPSALSRLLGRLEDELGVRLLERDTRRVELTEEGASFLSFAEESLRRRDELRLMLASSDGKLRGTLSVYASVTACYSILPPFAAAVHADHPELRLSVETGDPDAAERAVRDGRADLALAALPLGGFPDLACFSVRRTPLVLVAARGGPFGELDLERCGAASIDAGAGADSGAGADHDRRLARALGGVPLILPRSGIARERFDRWSRERSVKPHVAAETAGNEAVLALARLGLGLALVPRLVLDNSPFADGLVIYDAGPGFGDYDIGFVLRPSRSSVRGAANGRADSRGGARRAITALLERAYPEGSWTERGQAVNEGDDHGR